MSEKGEIDFDALCDELADIDVHQAAIYAIKVLRTEVSIVETKLERLQQTAEFVFGLLWMKETECPKVLAAKKALKDAFGGDFHECIRRGIKAAIDAGYEADHPPEATWWAGKKGGDDE